jgi:hypothetical protein
MCPVGEISEAIMRGNAVAFTAEKPLAGLAQESIVFQLLVPAHD